NRTRPRPDRAIVVPMDFSLGRVGATLLRNRRAVRAPIALYRNGFGWLLGSRMMMLEHVGRTSGLPRHAVLAVIRRPARDRLMVASGFGRRSQWYRNLEAEPRCHVSSGRIRRRPAEAVLLSPSGSEAELDRYRKEHPKSWEFLRRTIETDGAQDPRSI